MRQTFSVFWSHNVGCITLQVEQYEARYGLRDGERYALSSWKQSCEHRVHRKTSV